MSVFFPHVNLTALKKFAIDTAVAEHPLRQTRGMPPQRVSPRVVHVKDIVWAGEKMIQISFDPVTLPLGPLHMMAYFPGGRPRFTLQALVGMTASVRRRRADLAPKVYAYKDYKTGDILRHDPTSRTVLEVGKNDIGAEVVLIEKVPGEPLDVVWPKLSMRQQELVCFKLIDILLSLFYARGSYIGTDLRGTYVDTRCDRPQDMNKTLTQKPLRIPGSVLLTRALNDGPLADMSPPPAVYTVAEYLEVLAARVERVFDSNPISNIRGRDAGWLKDSPLTDQEVYQAKLTWERLRGLIVYHTGGFYLPAHLRAEERAKAYAILRDSHFGVYHSDMKMCRFLITPVPASPTSPPEIALRLATGWEHAYRAPAWSCARLPLWLDSVPFPLHQLITLERRRELRRLILAHLNSPTMVQTAHDWICCWVFGIPERWFEGVLSAHWAMQPTVEVCISRLKAYWEKVRPDVTFPVPVGQTHRTPPFANEEFASTQSLFVESVNALARASDTRPEDWVMAMRSGQFPYS